MIFDLLLKTSVIREYKLIPTIKHVMMWRFKICSPTDRADGILYDIDRSHVWVTGCRLPGDD